MEALEMYHAATFLIGAGFLCAGALLVYGGVILVIDVVRSTRKSPKLGNAQGS